MFCSLFLFYTRMWRMRAVKRCSPSPRPMSYICVCMRTPIDTLTDFPRSLTRPRPLDLDLDLDHSLSFELSFSTSLSTIRPDLSLSLPLSRTCILVYTYTYTGSNTRTTSRICIKRTYQPAHRKFLPGPCCPWRPARRSPWCPLVSVVVVW